MPYPPPITDDQLRALNLTVLQQGGALQNCIVHRTQPCHDRGGYFIGYPLPTGLWPAAGGHICADCSAAMAGRRCFDFPAVSSSDSAYPRTAPRHGDGK